MVHSLQNDTKSPETVLGIDARAIRKQYIDAVRKAVSSSWSSGKVEGKINELKPAWFTDILNRIQDHKANQLLVLLPVMNPSTQNPDTQLNKKISLTGNGLVAEGLQ